MRLHKSGRAQHHRPELSLSPLPKRPSVGNGKQGACRSMVKGKRMSGQNSDSILGDFDSSSTRLSKGKLAE